MKTLFYLLATSDLDTSSLPKANADTAQVQHILGIVWAVAGALALLFIVISGLRYIVSGGDPQATAKAKNGIIYALVGLVLAISAEAITVWVVGKL